MVDEAWEHSYPVSHRIVSAWARWAVFSLGLQMDLRRDVEQDLLLELWCKWQYFDGAGSRTGSRHKSGRHSPDQIWCR